MPARWRRDGELPDHAPAGSKLRRRHALDLPRLRQSAGYSPSSRLQSATAARDRIPGWGSGKYSVLRGWIFPAAVDQSHDTVTAAFSGMPADVTTEAAAVRGQADRVMVRLASQVGDLLVIGAGRRGTAGRMAGGYVSRSCVARVACLALAVPPSSLGLGAGHLLYRRRSGTGAQLFVR